MVQTKLNLEMAVTDEMVEFAIELQPQDCCLVPEKRQELTTEGGLDVVAGFDRIASACERLEKNHTRVSLFIDASRDQIDAAIACKAPCIEIHTGHFADAPDESTRSFLLQQINEAIDYAHEQGLQVNAGHGLHYHNVQALARHPHVVELNIGHAIMADALFHGLAHSVREMKRLMVEARLQCA